MEALERLFDVMREDLIAAVQFAGPWALPVLALLALILGFAFRDRLASPGGLIVLLTLAAFAITVRAVQMGRF